MLAKITVAFSLCALLVFVCSCAPQEETKPKKEETINTPTEQSLNTTDQILSSGTTATIVDDYYSYPDDYSHYHYANTALVNRAGKPAILYLDLNQHVKLARKTDTGWTSEIIHAGAGYLSAAVDSSNSFHFSFAKWSSGEVLLYKTNASGSWETYEGIGTGSSSGLENSIAVDSHNKAHISHWVWSSATMQYATNASGAWHMETSVPGGWCKTVIAVDNLDFVHIIYHSAGIKHMTNESGQLVSEVIDPGLDGYSSSNISISGNVIHVAWQGNNGIYYTNRQSGTWSAPAKIISPDLTYLQYKNTTGLASDSTAVYLVYIVSNTQTPYDGELRFATNKSGAWVTTAIDAGRYSNPSLVMINGVACIAVICYEGTVYPDMIAKLKYIEINP